MFEHVRATMRRATPRANVTFGISSFILIFPFESEEDRPAAMVDRMEVSPRVVKRFRFGRRLAGDTPNLDA